MAFREGRAVLIAGPTASGKSALALRVARSAGGAVVNADAMQVYADLRVLTARPSAEEQRQAPHHLYGMVDGADAYSTGRWLTDVADVLRRLREASLLPVIVGGTGLFFKALTEGLSDIPPVPAAIRQRLRVEAEGMPASRLHARLAAVDLAMARRLRPSDPQRILRALEVWEATGRSLADFQQGRAPALIPPREALALFLAPDRAALTAQSAMRFDAMLEAGALDEVARLDARALDASLPVMRALGVPQLLRHARGEIALADAADEAKRATRQYIKRQFTFARHQLPGFAWTAPDDGYDAIMRGLAAAA